MCKKGKKKKMMMASGLFSERNVFFLNFVPVLSTSYFSGSFLLMYLLHIGINDFINGQ